MSTSTARIDQDGAAASTITPAPLEQETASGRQHSRRWWVLVVAALAQLVVVLDATIVNIALPTAQASLGFSNDNRQWLVTGYALAFGALLLLGGRLSDLFGRRLMFTIGLLGFGAASALGGSANSFGLLLTARSLQGVFGALVAPAALSLLTVTFTNAAERARAFAIFGAVAGSGGAIGLILGGALTEYASWRWCMFVNVPLVVLAVIGAALLLPRQNKAEVKPKLDLPGTIVIVLGLVSLVYGLAQAETKGWTSGVTLGFIAAGLVLIAVFVKVETTVSHPLLPMRILADRTRGGAYAAVGIVGAGMFAVFLFLTYYLSTILAFTPLETGLSFLPMIGGLMVSVQLTPSVVSRIGAKVPVLVGMAVAAVGMLMLTQLDLHSAYTANILPGLVVMGLGIGAVMGTSFGAATQGVAAADAGVASAVVNTVQQIGGSIGTAVLSAVSAAAATNYLVGKQATPANVAQAAMDSYTTAFWWAAGIFTLGAVVCGLLLRHGAVAVDPEAPKVIAH
ncbi:drug resistance transporter, EmrB/QacA subfamily [Nakamurella panacisegetis]|uniref:Drug resistance transporter, EmrB/QacA subfamily n=1 Tax=Nakamurella panacisegetis TaxID=1090615 RepID=A0A1H0T767_9ACTN|nr:MFS transporter [Nakamurella panacisegetis]SDP49859.1 drug resistance transporter, EmrB/QacA subfamily [Nakamurella panacisegetis]